MATDKLDHSVLEISERIISERLDNVKVVSGKFTALDTDGHFTSNVKALQICFVNANDCGDKRSINLIAKVLENQKDDYLKLAFRKENEFYCSLIPMYNSISLSRNMDDTLTPNYFGGNISSTENEPSIILLDNLQYSGYKVHPNRFFDWDLTELIIDKMSLFHAFGIALKQLRSNIFEEDFKDLVEPALRNSNLIDRSLINLKLRTEIRDLLQKRPNMEELVPRVDALLEKIDNMRIPQPKNPFCTLIHNDLWKNNILLKYSDESTLIDVKFIDFQFVLYNSPIRDLAYFIFSSCSPDIQKEFRKISMLYYECFVKNLKKLKCDISEFTESRFVEEVNEFAPTKFKHLILLMKNTPNTFEERLIELVTSHAESDLL